MTPRLAVVGILHEANTFSSTLASLADYRAGGVHAGDDLVARYSSSESVIAGFVQPGDRPVEVVGLPVAMVTPCGPISDEAFETLVGEMVSALCNGGHLDGVLVVLHGAAVTESIPHADTELVRRIREAVGERVPLGAVLDMHANVDPALIGMLDIALAYQTNPHVDARRQAVRCRDLVLDLIDGRTRPATHLVQLPLIVPLVRQDTDTEPMRSLLLQARERCNADDDLIDVAILEGFPYADVPAMGMSVLATATSASAAQHAAEQIASDVWDDRQQLQGDAMPIAEAVVVVAGHHGERPLLVLDVGDNIGGGGPGDSTVLLDAFLAAGVDRVATTIQDPLVVHDLVDRSVGETVNVTLGGRSVDTAGGPIPASATITGVHGGTYRAAHIAHGGFAVFDPGAMVGLDLGGVYVAVTEKVTQPVAPEQFAAVGIDATMMRAILAKGVNGPRAGYSTVCGDVVEVDTPGITRNSVAELEYRHRRRPMFPFEPDTTFTPDNAQGDQRAP